MEEIWCLGCWGHLIHEETTKSTWNLKIESNISLKKESDGKKKKSKRRERRGDNLTNKPDYVVQREAINHVVVHATDTHYVPLVNITCTSNLVRTKHLSFLLSIYCAISSHVASSFYVPLWIFFSIYIYIFFLLASSN